MVTYNCFFQSNQGSCPMPHLLLGLCYSNPGEDVGLGWILKKSTYGLQHIPSLTSFSLLFVYPLSLQVRDGRMETDPLIGSYCGSALPAPIVSSSNFLWIRFRSDSSVSRAGFRAVYTVGEIPHIYTHM